MYIINNRHADSCKPSNFQPATLEKKETPTQEFSCKFYEKFKKDLFTEHSHYRTPPGDCL